jgi:hypothetical protein
VSDLHEQAAVYTPFIGRKVQHVATGGFYRVTGVHYEESTMRLVFSYETLQSLPVSFTRHVGEFLDGRFAFR